MGRKAIHKYKSRNIKKQVMKLHHQINLVMSRLNEQQKDVI